MKKQKLILVIFIAGLSSLMACNSSSVNKLDANAFQQAINKDPNAIVLDVRSPLDYSINHISGAENINIYDSDFEEQINKLDKSKPIYVYCKSGRQSTEATKALKDAGFSSITQLDGGILEWQANDLPLDENIAKTIVEKYDMSQYNEIIGSSKLVLFDFMADWCGPCKMMSPALHKLDEEYSDEELKIVKINIDHNREIQQNFQVNSIPVIKIYKEGELVHDVMGYQSEEKLREAIGKYL